MPKSLFEKVWDRHVVTPESPQTPAILYIDLHLIHEVTSPQAFSALDERGLKVRRPHRTLGTIDHSTPTLKFGAGDEPPYATPEAKAQVETLRRNCDNHGIALHDWSSKRRGIVHVIGPELGATQPGMTIVCGDSHTSTHGAFGALAFGIGATEVGHVLATQCVLQRKPKTMRVTFDNRLPSGVTAKDAALALISIIGADGGAGHVIEYAGSAVQAMDMESRMTLCNMSIEAGARAGMVAPDATTFDWLYRREYAPADDQWFDAVADWRSLRSDPDAQFDKEVRIDAAAITPMVTYGVSPDAAVGVESMIPAPRDDAGRQALDYMRFDAGAPVAGQAVNRVFIGSCTNSRMTDLREAARILLGRKVKAGVKVMIVPGSESIRREAEAEGLDEIFRNAGAEWRQPGCSMCIAMNGDQGAPGDLVVSTSNRNFMGRQGKGVRTVLASPATAAASAVAGEIADPRGYLDHVYVG